MEIKDLRNDNYDASNYEIENPNLVRNPPKKSAPAKREFREIDPVKELGLKTKPEADKEKNKSAVDGKAYSDMDKAIERRIQEVENFNDVYDQLEGDVTYEDLVELDNGFDPLALLNNPPRPGHTNVTIEQKKKMLRDKGYSEEEINNIIYRSDPQKSENRPKNTVNKPQQNVENTSKDIEYQNDDIDEIEELEKEILAGIPDEEDIGETPYDTEEYVTAKSPESNDYYDNNKIVTIKKDEYDSPVDNSDVMPEIPDKQINVDGRNEDDDLKALDEEVEVSGEDEVTKKRLELLKQSINSKIRPIAKKFDISMFTISKEPVTVNSSIKRAEIASPVKYGDWVLMGSERPVKMRSFKGTELEILVTDRNSRNNIQLVREQYGLLYNHIEDPYKPIDLDAWAKSTAVTDIDNLYACAYRATFEGVNFLPYDCQNPKCNHSFVTDSVPFMDLVKFKDEKAKKKFDSIFSKAPAKSNNSFKVDITPVSDTYAFGLKMPSIYDVVFVNAMLDNDFKEKYRDMLGIIPYIDKMYYIDTANSRLNPINIKEYRDNVVKSTKAKIITLSKIIKELTSDQYNLLKIYTNAITEEDSGMSYKLPSVTCEKCKSEIPESEYSASQLLFLRHHLASLANG